MSLEKSIDKLQNINLEVKYNFHIARPQNKHMLNYSQLHSCIKNAYSCFSQWYKFYFCKIFISIKTTFSQ
jgi:hypothetical protein